VIGCIFVVAVGWFCFDDVWFVIYMLIVLRFYFRFCWMFLFIYCIDYCFVLFAEFLFAGCRLLVLFCYVL